MKADHCDIGLRNCATAMGLDSGRFLGKFTLLLAMTLSAGLVFSGRACPQTPLPNPNLTLLSGGYVYALARTPDGGMILGGDFTSVNGVARNHIARLLPNGALDPDWNTSADAYVRALAVDSTGAIYAGGGFSNIGGLPRPGIAKLSAATGAADAGWNAFQSQSIYALALSPDGAIYAGGYFVAKLSTATGAMVPEWHQPGYGGGEYFFALAVDSGGAVYAGGQSLGPTIVKLDGVTGYADSTWVAPVLGTFGQYVSSLATESSGSVYAGGSFGMRKLSGTTGMADPTWLASTTDEAFALAVDANGAVFAGGFRSNDQDHPRGFISKLSGSTGAPLPKWDADPDRSVFALVPQPDGTVQAGGAFNSISGHDRIGFATLSVAGNVIGSAKDVEYPGAVYALAAQPSGGMIVAGPFLKAGQLPRRHILRLNADGTLDTKWNPSADAVVSLLAAGADGSVYAAGDFRTIGGQARNGLAKLSGSGKGSVDTNWNVSFDGSVAALAADASGALYVGGGFNNIGGLERRAIAKLSGATGNGDVAWNAAADGDPFIAALALAADGSVYAGGEFSNIGGQPRQNLAKLSALTGLADPDWDPSVYGYVYSLAVDPAGALFAGGDFGFIGGQERLLIAKISGGGSGVADPAWNADFGIGIGLGGLYIAYVYPLAVDVKGTAYASGFFTIGGDWSPKLTFAKVSGINGIVDRGWNPFADFGYGDTPVYAMAAAVDGSIYMGGLFKTAGGEPRYGLAAFAPTLTDPVFADGFEQTP